MTEKVEKRKKQQEKAALSRQKLIDVAAKLFREKTIDEVGVREIAAAADVTTGTFYYHFKSKDDILDKVYLDRDAEFGDILDRLAEESPETESIITFFRDDLAATVEKDGVDFTLHRMFLMRKKSTEINRLYQGMQHLTEAIRLTGGFDAGYSCDEITKALFLMFRGVVYDWCITPENQQDSLRQREDRAMRLICRSFR